MKKIALTFFLIINFMQVFAQQKVSITLSPEHTPDVTVSREAPTTNYKGDQLYVTSYLLGKAHLSRVLMNFDLSFIPVGSAIDSVVLRLKRYDHPVIGSGYGNELNIYKNTSTWSGNNVTWNTLPNRSDSAINSTINMPINWTNVEIKGDEFTEMFRYFVNNPDSNFGFQLCLPNENDSTNIRNCFFHSSNNGSSLRPVLDVYLSDNIAAIISPKPNDTIYNFDYTTIAWIAPPTINQIRLDYTTDGIDWIKIADSIPQTSGSYSWITPLTIDSFMLRMTDVQNPQFQITSNSYFKILKTSIFRIQLGHEEDGEDASISSRYGGNQTSPYLTMGSSYPPYAHSLLSLIDFDLTALPTNTQVLKASLSLFGYTNRPKSNLEISINKIPWQNAAMPPEDFSKFNNQATSKSIVASNYDNQWNMIGQDVKPLIEEMIVSNEDLGFRIKSVNNQTIDTFASSNSTIEKLRPELVIHCLLPTSNNVCNASFISPKPNDTIYNFDYTTIAWTAHSSINYIRLDYTTDGVNWIKIVKSIPQTNGSYSWLIPPTIDSFMLRLTDVQNPSCQIKSNSYFKILKTGILQLKPGPEDGQDISISSTYGGNPNSTELTMGYNPPPIEESRLSLINFDFSTLPTNAKIMKASLSLFSSLNRPKSNIEISINRIPWQNTAMPSDDFNKFNNQTVSKSIVASNYDSQWSLIRQNVKPLIEEMLVSNDDMGFMIKAVNNSTINIFGSSNAVNDNLRPELVIHYLISASNKNKALNSEVNTFSLYPNPASNSVFISLKNNYKTTLELRSIEGILIAEQMISYNNQEFIIPESVTSGIYFVTDTLSGKTCKLVLNR